MSFINAGLPSPQNVWICVWQLIAVRPSKKDHTWETGLWDGKAAKPFWNWLAKKTWSKEDFQISIRGSWGHPHARSSEGDVVNEWYLKEHGNHFRNPPSELKSFVSVQMMAFLSTCQYKYILEVLENLEQSLSSLSVLALGSFPHIPLERVFAKAGVRFQIFRAQPFSSLHTYCFTFRDWGGTAVS